MCDTPFPQDLVSVQALAWSADGRDATLWMVRDVSHTATVGGLVLLLLSFLSVQTLHVEEGDAQWIRTDGWLLPVLRLRPHTYWLHRVDEHEMLRLVYDAEGRLIFRYRLLRVTRGDGSRTRHHEAFLHARGHRAHWLV